MASTASATANATEMAMELEQEEFRQVYTVYHKGGEITNRSLLQRVPSLRQHLEGTSKYRLVDNFQGAGRRLDDTTTATDLTAREKAVAAKTVSALHLLAYPSTYLGSLVDCTDRMDDSRIEPQERPRYRQLRKFFVTDPCEERLYDTRYPDGYERIPEAEADVILDDGIIELPRVRRLEKAVRRPDMEINAQMDSLLPMMRVGVQFRERARALREAQGVHPLDLVENMLSRPQDERENHTYKGQLQPPLIMRLKHLTTMLCEDDVDRSIEWKWRAKEVEKYLDWVQTCEIGPKARRMVQDARKLLRVHEIYEAYHHSQTPYYLKRSMIPTFRGKLGGSPLNSDFFMRGPAVWEVPYHLAHRPVGIVRYEMEKGEVSAADIAWHKEVALPMLRSHQDSYWKVSARRAQQNLPWLECYDAQYNPQNSNFGLIEQLTYEKHVREPVRWTWVQHNTFKNTVPSGQQLQRRDMLSVALRRGAERAAIQYVLRTIDCAEIRALHRAQPWRRLVLPVPKKVSQAAVRRSGPNCYRAVAMDGARMPARAELEPFRFTIAARDFLREYDVCQRRGWARVQDVERDNPDWVTPQRVYNLPFTPRLVTPEIQAKQDLEEQCFRCYKALLRAQRIAPRNFLEDVIGFVEAGINGRPCPANLSLHHNDWEVQDQVVKMLEPRQVSWLRWLAQDSTSAAIQGRGPIFRTTLFEIFFTRVRKLLMDKNDQGVLKDRDWYRVDRVLEAINAGQGAVERYQFSMPEALCYFDRISKGGWIKFHSDKYELGFVCRPDYDLHPEHRLPRDWRLDRIMHAFRFFYQHEGPPMSEWQDWLFNGDQGKGETEQARILWKGVINAGLHRPDAQNRTCGMPAPEAQRFFHILAFRMGHTLFRIWREKAGWRPERMTTREQLYDARDRVRLFADGEWQGRHAYQHVREALRDIVENNGPTVPAGGGAASASASAAPPPPRADLETEMDGLMRRLRAQVVDESVRNPTPVWPTRTRTYTDARGNARSVDDCWDPIWSWAHPRVRGPGRRFFDVNRWPLKVQTEQTQRRIRTDADVDQQLFWDPVAEETIGDRWYNTQAPPLSRPRNRFRPGITEYPLGDTPLQREYIRRGLNPEDLDKPGSPVEPKPSFFKRLSSIFPMPGLRGKTKATDRERRTLLPVVDPAHMPRSRDPHAEADAAEVKRLEKRWNRLMLRERKREEQDFLNDIVIGEGGDFGEDVDLLDSILGHIDDGSADESYFQDEDEDKMHESE